MSQKLLRYCNILIEYGIYAIFFLVPLILSSTTSELFELNKMWLTWILTLIICASWLIKMVVLKKFIFQRTPLDIPIALFLFSQIISTFHSLDPYVSFWGYYSRFNGGLLSEITYIALYYTIASNFISNQSNGKNPLGIKFVKRIVKISLFSGLVVALWGLPSHFGSDPTCLLFRGTFDVSCWTADFHPTIRIFSTLGQPDWLSAYLCALIPLSTVLFLKNVSLAQLAQKDFTLFRFHFSRKYFLISSFYFLLTILFFLDFIFSNAKSGFLAFIASFIFFIPAYLYVNKKYIAKALFILCIFFLAIFFFLGTPFVQINRFTLSPLLSKLTIPSVQMHQDAQKTPQPAKTTSPSELGGTDSGKIRLYVWQGAVNAWKANALFGTGLETFAFAYYRYRPAGHNLTSEWNFLYNKAHNEYLNFLTTSGLFGLGSYLLIIFWFFFLVGKFLLKGHSTIRDPSANQKSANEITIALLTSFLSMLVINFFGFSVVIVNIYLFTIPAFVFLINPMLEKKEYPLQKNELNGMQWITVGFIVILAFYLTFSLFGYWQADNAYALGFNLDHSGDYVNGRKNLIDAIGKRDSEPVFKDELVSSDIVLITALANQKDATTAGRIAEEAKQESNQITQEHPNNVVFWKTRVRLFYTLSLYNPQYMTYAVSAIEKASDLAPNDASIRYNLGVVYGQEGDIQKAIKVLEEAIKLKPNYRDAYYALGLMYHTLAVDSKGKVVNTSYLQKSINELQYILSNINSSADQQTVKQIQVWKKEVKQS